MTYQCGTCNGAKPVVEILTSLRGEASDQACEDDLPIMYIGHLAIALEVDPQRLYDAIQRFTVAEAKREQKAAEQAKAKGDDSGGQAAADPFLADSPDDRQPDQALEGRTTTPIGGEI